MKSLQGEISNIPGDKSITHRAIILASLAEGESRIVGYLPSEDCNRTIRAFQQMGIAIDEDIENRSLCIHGRGLSGLTEPSNVIDCGNSGTTLRLLMGVLAGQEFHSILTGDTSLRSRPMRRVVTPLRTMRAKISGRSMMDKGGERCDADLAPLAIRWSKELTCIEYTLPVASAQVKSALFLAGLTANGTTTITDPYATRDHTERMLQYFGADFTQTGNTCKIVGRSPFKGKRLSIPGDFSSAAFFMVAALILPGSCLSIKNVGVNPTRTGLFAILKQMGANISMEWVTTDPSYGGEPIADICVTFSPLKGRVVEGKLIPQMIDEFPILCIAAAAAEGTTVIRGAQELRFKESDRIHTMANALKVIAGVTVKPFSDGIVITGSEQWRQSKVKKVVTEGDHRVAMAMKIASLRIEGEITLDD